MARRKAAKAEIIAPPPPPVEPLIAVDRPDLFPDQAPAPRYEVMCVYCHKTILARDPREDLCEACYWYQSEELEKMAQMVRRSNANRPLFHVP